MKKRFLVLLTFMIVAFCMVGCSNKDDTQKQDSSKTTVEEENLETVGDGYYDIYTRNYETSLLPLSEYSMYGDFDIVEEYYQTNEYPGNEKYLEEVKTALRDTRDNVQIFVNNMETDGKTDNKDIERLNKEMIDDGRDLIDDIDDRLEDLDKITTKDLEKPEAEFRRLVNDHIVLEAEEEHSFRKILRDLDKELKIERKGTEADKK